MGIRSVGSILGTGAARTLGVLMLAAALAACGGDDPAEDNNTVTVPGDDAGDVSADADAGDQPDGEGEGDAETDSDTGPDGDTGPAEDDLDGDGVLDDEDNCPEDPNPEQLDRDRDGIGDVCDHFPSIHDPENPEEFDTLVEDEDDIPNDSSSAGEAYDIELPFRVEGNVGEIEDGSSDWDYYSFTTTEPTLLLIDISADGDDMWPGGVVLGYEVRNGNVSRFALGDETGGGHYREVFLPVPGKYSLIVTDARNMMSTPDVGGEDFDYVASISQVPFPEVEEVSLPTAPIERDVDRAVHIYEIDPSELDALEVTSAGDARNDNSFVLPMLTLYDPDDKRSLSFTSPEQTSDTAIVELTTKIGERDRVWVIEDFWQRLGVNRTLLEVNTTTVESEFETFSEPQDERFSELIWLQPDMTVEGTIGPPRTVSGTQLAADTDYFLATTKQGTLVTFTVNPLESSMMQPDVELGFLYESQGSSQFYWMDSAPSADAPGEPTSLSTFVNSGNVGEVALHVQHAPNVNAESPEGGPGFEYEVSMFASEPEIDDLGTLPVTASGVFDTDGETDFYSFEAEEGDRINLRVLKNGFFGPMSIYDRDTFATLASTYSDRLGFVAPHTGEFVVHLAPYSDDRDPSFTYDLGVEEITATDMGTLPAQQSGVVDNEPFPAWYKMSVVDGAAYEITLDDQDNFDGRLRVYDGADMSQVRGGSGSVRWVSGIDGEVFIEVADVDDLGDPTYDFVVDAQELDADTLTVDTPKTGQLADGGDRIYYSFDAPEGAIEAHVEPTGSWTPEVTLVSASTLNPISNVEGFEGELYHAESNPDDYALLVEAADPSLTDPLDFTVEFTMHDAASGIDETEPNDTLADAENIGQLPGIFNGSLDGNNGDESDVYTVDLVAGQRVWLLSNRRGSGSLYSLRPELVVYDPQGAEVTSDQTSGEGYFPAIYAFEATEDGTWEIHHQLRYADRSGDYTLYVFASDAP